MFGSGQWVEASGADRRLIYGSKFPPVYIRTNSPNGLKHHPIFSLKNLRERDYCSSRIVQQSEEVTRNKNSDPIKVTIVG